jgi:SM-20-related protein
MPRSDFFARLGVFVAPGFLSADACAAVRDEMRVATPRPGTMWRAGSPGEHVDLDRKRRAEMEGMPPTAVAALGRRFEELLPVLSRHFDLPLRGFEPLKFVRYRPGDFYAAHTDASDSPSAPEYVRQRRVTAVLFLNGQSEDGSAASYAGGELTLFGLLADRRWRGYGFPLIGEEGLLVAFRAGLVHEVAPIVRGERHTVTTWLF